MRIIDFNKKTNTAIAIDELNVHYNVIAYNKNNRPNIYDKFVTDSVLDNDIHIINAILSDESALCYNEFDEMPIECCYKII